MKHFLTILALLASSAALAQAPPREADRPADPPSSIVRSMCDALAGAERERCIAEQQSDSQRRTEPFGRPDSRGACDHLIGPEKELCLKKGGSVKAGIGATRPPR